MGVEIPKTLSDHPQLVGIVRFPSCTVTTQEMAVPTITKNEEGRYQSIRQSVNMATSIVGADVESGPITITKSAITDFYPYTYYVLTDNEVEPLIMQPQHMPNSLTIHGKFALSHQPIERYYPSSYKGDITGNVYNITNTSQMMLPTSTNEGISYMNANANSISESRKGQVISNVLSGLQVVGSINPSNPMGIASGISNMISGFQQIKELDARNKDTMLTPNTISSYGTPSTRKSFNTDNVRLIKYTISPGNKEKINNYVARYGNKYNNFATINHLTYKGFVKTIDTKITTNIDSKYSQVIREIFERGVYIE